MADRSSSDVRGSERSIGVLFVGDEVGAAGYRLGGAEVVCPTDAELSVTLERGLAESRVMLIASAVASRLPDSRLSELLASVEPLVGIVPSPGEQPRFSDVGVRARRHLGMEAGDE